MVNVGTVAIHKKWKKFSHSHLLKNIFLMSKIFSRNDLRHFSVCDLRFKNRTFPAHYLSASGGILQFFLKAINVFWALTKCFSCFHSFTFAWGKPSISLVTLIHTHRSILSKNLLTKIIWLIVPAVPFYNFIKRIVQNCFSSDEDSAWVVIV